VPESLCVLLLPRPLERFILRDQAEDLLRAVGVVAVDPPRLPYGVYGRVPEALASALGASAGRRLVRALRARGAPRAVVIFHPLQYPVARAAVAAAGEAASCGTGAGTATRRQATPPPPCARGWPSCTSRRPRARR
jgi:hypothetical protein